MKRKPLAVVCLGAISALLLLSGCSRQKPWPEPIREQLSEFQERAKWLNELDPPPRATASKVLGGSTTNDWESFSFKVDGPVSPTAVAEHYAGALQSRGWASRTELSEDGIEMRTFGFLDGQSLPWHAVLITSGSVHTEGRTNVALRLTRVGE